ncbi:PTS system sucrose-specific IIA component, Glc family /PTS system sucrose-specific IIB component, Glc family /PTS system sucrose-specific IIC component, Glc family [Oribacterium sp. KHPX15]|uniref:PTS beta-glucoside transporter subunit IIBCA n=1 Tax=Oribacterium sp. KHPX15 TaxID=1855342 RepID=UPI00089D00B1|nr:PTS transporter subunit IIBCA [Oribacterium sp. KHPX15]SDZ98042.1 PTS system sucrose-specific IIA component, Glc family /PTS system sucrose-specific IIB component, Glc family /PTS system sucrose-specific IIC component, Glc family [Oribacterium sp. KHPX15]
MALDYRKCAQEIVDHIGGRDNVAQAAHCATRLRLVIKDNSKVDKEYLDNVEGVKGMFESNGQLQLIIGTGTVNKVYDEFLSITGMTAATKDDVKAAAAAKQPLWKQLLKPIGDVFVPILPAIVASGLMMGLVEALGKIPGLNFAGTDWYAFLDMVANTAFAYLPVIVAISAARVFGGNIFLGAVIGLLMIHSALTNGWNAAAGYDVWYLFGHIRITESYSLFQINQLGYQGHVIPVIIAVLLMSNVEKWFHKHVPEMLDLFITPLCTVLITALITFTIIGPIFSGLETMVLNGAQVLVKNPLGAMVMGAIYPVTVVMGLHHMYNVIEAGMLSSVGLNTWMPIASAANFAQFGACLAVGLKSQSNKTKVIAVPSALSAALGITEPAIFGVNLRFYKPFVAGMVGGAIGSIFGAITGIGATAYGVTGIPGYLTINNAGVYTVLLLVSGGVAFAGTWSFWKEEVKKPVNKPVDEAAETVKFEQKPVITCEAGTILAPINGNVIPQDKIPDGTFASGVLGAGVGIEPEGEIVYAPFDGEVSSVAESKHAIGLSGPGDMEVLIHVGVDTVAMNGEGFEPLVEDGDKVKAGQPILKFSKAAIKAADHPDVVVVLLTNSDDYKQVSV